MQTGSLLLNAVSPSQVTIQVPRTLTGFNTVLNASSLTTSPVAAGAQCVYVAFASSVPVDAFLSTYDDFVSLVTDKCAPFLIVPHPEPLASHHPEGALLLRRLLRPPRFWSGGGIFAG